MGLFLKFQVEVFQKLKESQGQENGDNFAIKRAFLYQCKSMDRIVPGKGTRTCSCHMHTRKPTLIVIFRGEINDLGLT